MRILLTESDPGAGDAALAALEGAGHQVVRCFHGEAPAFPCNGLAGGDCPVEGGVDVALAVRPRAVDEPTTREMGVTCALRRHVPLVVAGGDGPNPYATWTSERLTSDHPDLLLGAVTEAAEAPLDGHAAIAAAEARKRGCAAPRAHAERQPGGVTVRVEVDERLAAARKETLGVQVASAVRRFDPWAGVIDVTVEDRPGG